MFLSSTRPRIFSITFVSLCSTATLAKPKCLTAGEGWGWGEHQHNIPELVSLEHIKHQTKSDEGLQNDLIASLIFDTALNYTLLIVSSYTRSTEFIFSLVLQNVNQLVNFFLVTKRNNLEDKYVKEFKIQKRKKGGKEKKRKT